MEKIQKCSSAWDTVIHNHVRYLYNIYVQIYCHLIQNSQLTAETVFVHICINPQKEDIHKLR